MARAGRQKHPNTIQPRPLARFPITRGRADLKSFGIKLVEAGAQGGLLWGGDASALSALIQAVSGAAETIHIKREVPEVAWELVRNSLIRAMADLYDEGAAAREPAKGDLDHLKARLEIALDEPAAEIPHTLFKNPGAIPIVAAAGALFAGWLRLLDLNEAEAASLANRLPTYVAFAFHEEWRSNRDHYQPIANFYDTPFDTAVQLAWDWERNRLELIRQLDERVFEESFSLRQVYVPLRAYWQERTQQKSGHEAEDGRLHVVALETAVRDWLTDAQRCADNVCLVFGGPGSGKSTFARYLAMVLSVEDRFRVLFVALQRFDMEDKIESAIGNYLRRQGSFTSNPFEQPNFASAKDPLLLIFDGLDELTKPGDYADQETMKFMTRLNSALSQWNGRERAVLAMITGRTASVQAHGYALDLNERQRLSVLPYFVAREGRRPVTREGRHLVVQHARYDDPNGLLEIDQRRDWWTRYSAAKAGEPPDIPKALLAEDLIELTAEPLLNYLVVLSGYHRDVKSGERVNRNAIYARLYKDVVKRRHAGGRPLAAAKEVSEPEFDRLMEAIAVAAWHGGGRSASIAEIQATCPDDLKPLLQRFLRDRQPARLFAAFYFKAAEDRSPAENAFEFTHKSFGEYLTALRLVREVGRLDKGLRDNSEFVTEDFALRDWCRLTSPRAMSMELLRFLRDEVALRDRGEVARWQETLTRLFNRNLKMGPPIEAFENRSFRLIEQKVRNAEETLLAALNACARVTQVVTRIAWDGIQAHIGERPGTARLVALGPPLRANNVVHRLRGQRWPPDACVALECLGWFDWKASNLVLNDLYAADLAHSVLAQASLIKTELGHATLRSTDLRRADLIGTHLRGADLSGANLSHANLNGADLREAKLSGANLTKAELGEADLSTARGLTQKQLDQAWGDKHTKLPEGLSIRPRPRKTEETAPIRATQQGKHAHATG